jgi:putative endonuclease
MEKRSAKSASIPIRERHARGKRAELAVADYLTGCGFSVLDSNVRAGRLEVDLIARRGPLVVMVEVRTRGGGSFASALASVTRTKRRRLLQAAERLWRERIAKMDGVTRVRIDVAAVTFEGDETLVEYVEGAVVGGDGDLGWDP